MKPIHRAIVMYLVSAVGITALAFYVVFPVWSHLVLSHASMNPQSALYYLVKLIPQYFIYALNVLVFYFFVARPSHLHPLFGKGHGYTRRGIIIALCIVISYATFSPFDFMLVPINGVGILTFMITGICEEWMYRGVIIKVFKEYFGIVWAVIISAVLFALSHWGEIFLHAHNTSLKIDIIGIGQDLVFGLVFGVIVWRCHSLVWAAFLHCISDWQPYALVPGRPWMMHFHLPWLELGVLQIYVVGLRGAEIIRVFTSRGKLARSNTAEQMMLTR